MFKCAIYLATAIALSGALPATAGDPAEPDRAPVRIVELTPGVFASLQPDDDRFNDANSLFVVGDDWVVVVDPPSMPQASAALIRAIQERTQLPVRFLVNTHWHPDHTEGNEALVEAFGGEPRVLGHETLTVDVPDRAAVAHAEDQERYRELLPRARQQLVDGLRSDGSPLSDADREAVTEGIAYVEEWLAGRADRRFLPPTITYDRHLTLHLGSRRIELHHLRGHTAGDTVVYLPDDGIVASGDLLDELPFVGHGYPTAWIESLELLAGLEFSRVVPGHGPIFEGRTALELELGYLRDLVSQVKAAIGDGLALDQAQESIDLTRWREAMARDDRARRFFDGVRSEAIERAWADLTGTLDRR